MFLDDFYPLPGPAAATSARCRPRTPRPSQRGCRGRPAGWMNGGGGCEVYWLLTWVGNSNHPCQNGYGSIPINTIFSGMNIHLPAILMWTTGVLLVLTHCQMSKPIEYNGFGPRMVKLFFNEQFDGPSETSFSVGRSNTSGILSQPLSKQRLEEEIISTKQMVVTLW